MNHIALIMDGNGRWAESRGLNRLDGHVMGANAVENAIKAGLELDINYLTFYAFSNENYKRSKREILGIFDIIAGFLEERLLPLVKQFRLRVRFIGELKRLSPELLDAVIKVNKAALNNDGMTVVIALGYGGRDEVVEAINKLISDKFIIGDDSSITYEDLEKYLYTSMMPDPEIIVRYGGYKRLSNFLPLQGIYSELMFTDKLWPDFDKDDLIYFINEFHKIKRNFGDV